MDDVELVGGLIPEAFARAGAQSLARFSKRVRALLASRRLPDQGWSDSDIRLLLLQVAQVGLRRIPCSLCAVWLTLVVLWQMDSNNFADAAGVGEREGRVYSSLVAERNFGLAHGMGRSGNLIGPQPKAAGSSLLVKLANLFVVQLIQGKQ